MTRGTGPALYAVEISDLHVGRKASHVRRLPDMLEPLLSERQVPLNVFILGDFLDRSDDLIRMDGSVKEKALRGLPKGQLNMLEFLAAAHTERRASITVVEGNHDRTREHRLLHVRPHPLFPYPVREYIHFTLGGQGWLGVHGHFLDPEWLHKRWLSEGANDAYRLLQKWDSEDAQFARWAEKRVTGGRRRTLKKLLPVAAVRYAHAVRLTEARLRDLHPPVRVNHIICGHSHEAVEDRRIHPARPYDDVGPDDPAAIHYHNAGNWVDRPKDGGCGWLAIRHDGSVKLHHHDW
ncbi:MAG TPA: metallophosphoesterase [Candidatus Paceibacterota bacterium]|nr:metallophosphoesterase [Candidatus Paceibacterota bacterium]